MEETNDAELVKLARADNTDAFNQLLERYQIMALYIGLRFCRDEEIARELVQEATLQAYLSLDHLQNDALFKNWFYGIVLNICRNWQRHQKSTSFSFDTGSGSSSYESFLYNNASHLFSDPQQIVEEHELQHLVREAVTVLSPKNRQVTQLFYYEDMSIQEIALSLHISPTAVKNRLLRGREQLRTHLQTVYPDLVVSTTRKRKDETMISVKLAGVFPQQFLSQTTVLLLDEQEQRVLPLQFSHRLTLPDIRMYTSMRQDRAIEEPSTADLITNLLAALNRELKKVVIVSLQGDLLYARVYLHGTRGQHAIKAHLNDALPLAVRLDCEFAVAGEVLERRGISLEDKGATLEQQLATVGNLIETTSIPALIPTQESEALAFTDDGQHRWNFSGDPEYCDYHLDRHTTYTSKASLCITLREGDRAAHLEHTEIQADSYRGQRLRMVAYIKAEDVASATLSLTVSAPPIDPEDQFPADYTTQNHQPIKGTCDWTRHELVIDIPNDASTIMSIFRLENKGRVWLDGFRFEVVDKSVPLTGTWLVLPPRKPLNSDFRQGLMFWQLVGSGRQNYSSGVDATMTFQAEPCVFLKAAVAQPYGAGTLQQSLMADDYRGQRIRLSASIKTVDVEVQASLFLFAEDRIGQTIRGTSDWQHYEVILHIPKKSSIIDFGITLHGRGLVWLANVHLDLIEE
ncbi:MAG: bifunctional nuclease family protein [Ktedonobacteraceae bacterium]|nr:bifunctional nuclease family protein [Ktedonobacteraceae bacterium]